MPGAKVRVEPTGIDHSMTFPSTELILQTCSVICRHRSIGPSALNGVCECVMLQLWTVQPPPAKWITRGQPAHTPPQRPPGAKGKGTHKGRKRDKQRQGTDRREAGRKGEWCYDGYLNCSWWWWWW
eukprot:363226-Chlamydomonas_euryale.AAC.2